MLWSGSSHTLRVRSEFGLEQQQQRELEQQRELKQQQRAQLEQQPRPEGLRRELLRLDRGRLVRDAGSGFCGTVNGSGGRWNKGRHTAVREPRIACVRKTT